MDEAQEAEVTEVEEIVDVQEETKEALDVEQDGPQVRLLVVTTDGMDIHIKRNSMTLIELERVAQELIQCCQRTREELQKQRGTVPISEGCSAKAPPTTEEEPEGP